MANKIRAIKNKRRAINFSQKLIDNATPAELILKKELEKRNVYFEFQKAVPSGGWKKRFYIPDFTLYIQHNGYKTKLYVEIDGNHHQTSKQLQKDTYRTQKLEKLYRNQVLRFTNQEVIENVTKIINQIKEYNLWHPIRSHVLVKHPKADINIIKASLLNNYRTSLPNQM
ncbi:endonuclease domain-containing protein [Patescibacteria group bacterium]|nr:endonuclease domain-containing protein [Patescibacteria group bacterium]